jgi:pimeloyl-ACP methyl ester carboxylesterase
MERVKVNGVELEYEVKGSGEPVLLIGTGPIAGSFKPFSLESALAERYRLIRYHRRGQGGSAYASFPVSFAQHASDAAALLNELGVDRAHVAGHSTGGDIALQLAFGYPERVNTLALLEPALMSVPSAGTFFEQAGPSVQAYGAGDREGAVAGFISLVCSLDWEECRALLDQHVPGSVAQAIKDAGYLFESELPALSTWQFGPEQAATIALPVLSVLGTDSERLFVEGRELIHSWFPQAEDCTIEGVAHLLHLQRPKPVIQGIAEFLARHPIARRVDESPGITSAR